MFVKPADVGVIRARLEEKGLGSDEVEEALKSAREDSAHANTGEFYDLVLENHELDNAYKSLEGFIYGTTGESGRLNGDLQMEDAPASAPSQTGQANGV